MKHFFLAGSVAAMIAAAAFSSVRAAGLPACDPDNGGLKLPQGFCALVAADDVGAARHMVVCRMVICVTTQGARGTAGVVGLTNGDGRWITERFGNTTGARNGYLYIATISSVERFKLTTGVLKPGPAEVVVADLPITRPHQDKGIAFDGRGGLYVSIGAPSNACQPQDRRPKLAGQDPCPLLEYSGGIWKFDENKLGQKQADGTRYATGMRQMPAITWQDGRFTR
jgi:glucose/arabinose dehydrogenase